MRVGVTSGARADTLAGPLEEAPLRFCASLAFTDPAEYLALARCADAHGWDSFVLSDHLVHLASIASRYPYSRSGERPWVPEAPWPDVWVATAAMAAVTERLRFLQGVYVLPLRDPFSVAKALGTAAVLSNHRVGLGLGLGWMREEFEVLGAPFEGRGSRTDEMIEVMRKLWTGEMVEHHGRHFSFERLRMCPGVPEPIPIIVGGSSEAALRRVARIGDGWAAHLLTSEELRVSIERIRGYRREAGRATEPLLVYAPCRDAFDVDGFRRLEEIGVTHLMTVPWWSDGGPAASLDAKLAALARFSEDVIARM